MRSGSAQTPGTKAPFLYWQPTTTRDGRYVFGVEADLAGTNTKGGTACGPLVRPPPFPFSVTGPMFQMTCNAKADWLATAAARVGYTWGRALFYVNGPTSSFLGDL
jgi:hypothetical protein